MAVSVAQYSVDEFNSLYDYGDVLPKFDELDGTALAHRPMKDLFRRHGVEKVFGLSLLHKHGDLEPYERLTDIRGTSSPLLISSGSPSIWRCKSEDGNLELLPLEFSFETHDVDWKDAKIQKFLVEFSQLLRDLGAEKILGLCVYPGDDYPGRLEITIGRSNVNLTPDEVSWSWSLAI